MSRRLFVLIGAAQNWSDGYKQYAPDRQPRDADILLIDPEAHAGVERDLKRLSPRNRVLREPFNKGLIDTLPYETVYVINYTADIAYRDLRDQRWVVIYCGHCFNGFPLAAFDEPLSPGARRTIDRLNEIRAETVLLHNTIDSHATDQGTLMMYNELVERIKTMDQDYREPHAVVLQLSNGLLDKDNGLLLNIGTTLFYANRGLDWKFVSVCGGRYTVREAARQKNFSMKNK